MKLDTIKTAVTSKVGRQVLVGQKHSPHILFGAGVVGVVASTVLACKATLKLDDVLEETNALQEKARTLQHKDYSDADRVQDLAKIKTRAAGKVVKLYAPSVALGVISIGMLTGSHVVLSKRNTALMAAYSVLDKGFNEYRNRVREELGDDADAKFRYGTETVTETVEGKDGKKTIEKEVIKNAPSIYARLWDEQSSSWNRQPEYNQLFIQCQQNYANDLLRARGHLFLNEVYDLLGLARTPAGAVVGWVMGNGDNFVDFGLNNWESERIRAFLAGQERSVLLDFNVDGVIYDKI